MSLDNKKIIYIPKTSPTATPQEIWVLKELRRVSNSLKLVQEALEEAEERLATLEP